MKKVMKEIMLGWLALLLLAPALRAKGARPAGFVALYRGPAWVERAGQKLEPRTGLPVYQGDFLVTGRRGRLKVLFSDDAVVSLGSGTRVEITRHLYDPAAGKRSTRLHMLGGKLRALVQRLVAGQPADFKVHTRNAVAGVRGTEFVVVDTGQESRLVTLSGNVAFAASGREPVMVAAGNSSRVQADGRVEEPQLVAAAEMARLREETDTGAPQQAVALALPPLPTERLGRRRGGRLVAVAAGGGAPDLQPGQGEAVEPTGIGNPNDSYRVSPPISGAGDLSDTPRESGFTGSVNDGFGQGEGVEGSWLNPDVVANQSTQALTLRIVLHR